ncbi:MAG: HAD family hydrolase [Anaerolineae bacterium]|nr:HAD family hydrolase [Anaerolineae bacterium]
MTLQAILFDLDGTLLDYDLRNDLLPPYLEALAKWMAPYVAPRALLAAIERASEAIAESDGARTNEAVFAEHFYNSVEVSRARLEPHFLAFYRQEFPHLQQHTRSKPEAREVVLTALKLGFDVVIATNPYFPETATRERLRWAGVADLQFRKITTYENSHAVKPHLRYYEEILAELACAPEKALMVGDESMDMVAGCLGCPTFLVPGPATDREAIAPRPTYEGDLHDLRRLLPTLRKPESHAQAAQS